MADQRPSMLDLRSQSSASVPRSLKSPRLHVAGEVPPELSPLDAFALQSRLLAKQLQESARNGNRVSRLPPLTTDSPLMVQGRSDYFRSMSAESSSEAGSPPPHITGFGVKMEVEDANRPRSMHPRMSRIPPTPEEPMPALPSFSNDHLRDRPLDDIKEDASYFGARRDRSPSPISVSSRELQACESHGSSQDSHRPPPSPSHIGSFSQSPEKPIKQGSSFDSASLLPPRPQFPKRTSSVMSSPAHLGLVDEDATGDLMSQSFHSQPSQPPRKLSGGSGVLSPGLGSLQHRSSSISSDMSAPLPRPSFNFSRPLSRAGTPTIDLPARQASSDSQASFILTDDTAHTPVSMHGETFLDHMGDDSKPAAPSYIYSKFSLPRGKILQRNSAIFTESQPQASFQWEQPIVPPSNIQTIPYGGQAPPSPPTRPSSSSGVPLRPSLEKSKLSTEMSSAEVLGPAPQSSPNPSRPSTDEERWSEEGPRGRSLTSPVHDDTAARGKTPMSTTTADSGSTIKPARSQISAVTADMSADEQVTKAIALHESGSLNESTYHLRLAARQNHPTGMLLYALACRHGWGMRRNEREGVLWLRRAAEYASVEIADDEEHLKEGKMVNVVERKTRKAQFALSIYELGVSHLNGWGIEQDKALALRCFEIAGSWGDIDALAEAGFCYAQGIGCKKNLKKSAKFYRQAEAKGMSMVGNSWIHKSKYDDNDLQQSAKKARSKSRSRGLFGKKTAS